jgi:hypothetical protein
MSSTAFAQNVPLEQVPYGEKHYAHSGNTALFDAIGDTVSKLTETHPVLGERTKVLRVIQNGMARRNASQRPPYNRIMIRIVS